MSCVHFSTNFAFGSDAWCSSACSMLSSRASFSLNVSGASGSHGSFISIATNWRKIASMKTGVGFFSASSEHGTPSSCIPRSFRHWHSSGHLSSGNACCRVGGGGIAARARKFFLRAAGGAGVGEGARAGARNGGRRAGRRGGSDERHLLKSESSQNSY